MKVPGALLECTKLVGKISRNHCKGYSYNYALMVRSITCFILRLSCSMVNLLSLLMFALFSENKHGQVQVSPPLGNKLAFLFLPKFGDRKNLLAIFLFCFFLRAGDAFWIRLSARDFGSRIRHQNALTEKAWEDAVQGLGKPIPYELISSQSLISICSCFTRPLGHKLAFLSLAKFGDRKNFYRNFNPKNDSQENFVRRPCKYRKNSKNNKFNSRKRKGNVK